MTTLNLISKIQLPTGVLGASITPDGATLAAACMDGVYSVDVSSKSASKLGEHRSYASSAVLLNASREVVSAGYDGVVQWFKLSDRSFVREKKLHDFWSWDMTVSPDESMIASVTGQYLAGGYKYEPAAESEPSVRIVSAKTGTIIHSLPHVPSVQSVAFSPDSRFVAAGNLMGEVRIWDAHDGTLVRSFTTDGFTSWGIIKSHSYLGGIFAMSFSPNGNELLLAGMGPMRDPMAGNGRQLWEKWAWNKDNPTKVDETHKGESGEGLMETVAVHPDGKRFIMGGRLRGGDWNAAMFDLEDGKRIASLKTGFRMTQAMFTSDGKRLIVAGTNKQPNKLRDGRFPDFGRIEIYAVT